MSNLTKIQPPIKDNKPNLSIGKVYKIHFYDKEHSERNIEDESRNKVVVVHQNEILTLVDIDSCMKYENREYIFKFLFNGKIVFYMAGLDKRTYHCNFEEIA